MKNIFLIGDSIRHGSIAAKSPGYGGIVRDCLELVANVYMPSENCRFAQHTLRGIRDWARQLGHVAAEMDVVHFNCGLWDVQPTDSGEILTPLEIYVYFLERIYREIRILFPRARVVFALTTAVCGQRAPKCAYDFNETIAQYNAAARERLEPLGCEINDLYSITAKFDESYYVEGDWIHQNKRGAERLADAVIDCVMK